MRRVGCSLWWCLWSLFAAHSTVQEVKRVQAVCGSLTNFAKSLKKLWRQSPGLYCRWDWRSGWCLGNWVLQLNWRVGLRLSKMLVRQVQNNWIGKAGRRSLFQIFLGVFFGQFEWTVQWIVLEVMHHHTELLCYTPCFPPSCRDFCSRLCLVE